MKKISFTLVLIMLLSCVSPFIGAQCDGISNATASSGAGASSGSHSGNYGSGSSSTAMSPAYDTAFTSEGALNINVKKIKVNIRLSAVLENGSVGYAAMYKNDLLLETKVFGLDTLNPTVDFDFDGTVEDYNQGGYAIKLFAFDAFLKPAAKCKTVTVKDESDSVVTVISDDIEETKCTENQLWFYDVNDALVYVTLSSACRASYNGAEYVDIANTDALFELIADDYDGLMYDVILKLKDDDFDGEYDCIDVWFMSYDLVDHVRKYSDGTYRIGTTYNGSCTIDYTSQTVDISDADGEAINPDKLSEGDIIAYCTDAENNAFRNFNYIKIVKIEDYVEGEITHTATSNGYSECTINNVTYGCSEYLYLTVGDSGKFYIGLSGKIFYAVFPPAEYAYILEFTQDSSAFGVGYVVKLLTAHDGVKTYTFTTSADNAFDRYRSDLNASYAYRQTFGEICGTSEMGNLARFISFKTNAEGQIKSFEQAGGNFIDVRDKEYKASTNRIDKSTLEDDAVVYYLNGYDADEAYTASIDELGDGFTYSGYVFRDADGENSAFIVTDYIPVLSGDMGFAVVTGIAQTEYDGDYALNVSYYKDEVEETIIFTDDSEVVPHSENISFDDLKVGDVFDIAESSDGVVKSYVVLGTIDINGILSPYESSLRLYSDENVFVFGYIANTAKRAEASKDETIEVKTSAGSKDYCVSRNTNKYSCFIGSSRTRIISGDMWGGNTTDYFDDEKNTATPVFMRLVDGEVKDVYTFDTRADIAEDGTASINGEKLELLYVE